MVITVAVLGMGPNTSYMQDVSVFTFQGHNEYDVLI